MITLRNSATAFLRNNEKILLIKRGDDRAVAPGVWSGIGGHMEESEINSPLLTCFREIEEECGIARKNIQSLDLLYIIIRRFKDEIRQNYIYFGETTQSKISVTDEGELFWIPEEELLNRRFTPTFMKMLEHFKAREKSDFAIYAGTAGNDCDRLIMTWSRIEDFE